MIIIDDDDDDDGHVKSLGLQKWEGLAYSNNEQLHFGQHMLAFSCLYQHISR